VVRALVEVDARALIFPLNEPDGCQAANRRLIQLANERPQQLRALVRVDPADDPTGQVRDGLDLGAVGAKLPSAG